MIDFNIHLFGIDFNREPVKFLPGFSEFSVNYRNKLGLKAPV
ncbi:hypothetical protein CLOLEP_02590 [[Clostridium] leptum DSM 753]|uniref:Uncharacterized protein n=1 Tax=[Clostridium] leptum DSM 753 TaxID=428125 RepID=A7VVH9_9FIRM|nr:hypothetical protein CLOLEP_02590 [[Clostridium] leptum DSM 753]